MRERIARIELRRGGMIVLFEGVARFTIGTPEATITVLPSCLLRLDVDESRTRAICVRGKFYATPKNGKPVAIEAGYFREWPSERGAVFAAEDRRGVPAARRRAARRPARSVAVLVDSCRKPARELLLTARRSGNPRVERRNRLCSPFQKADFVVLLGRL